MNNKQIGIIIIAVILGLYFLGGSLNENCKEINTCKKCWKTTPIIVSNSSDGLCSSSSCLANAEAQKNNAIVDVLLCSCELAKQKQFSDSDLNKKIENTVKDFSGYNINVNTFCSQPSLILSKRVYG